MVAISVFKRLIKDLRSDFKKGEISYISMTYEGLEIARLDVTDISVVTGNYLGEFQLEGGNNSRFLIFLDQLVKIVETSTIKATYRIKKYELKLINNTKIYISVVI